MINFIGGQSPSVEPLVVFSDVLVISFFRIDPMDNQATYTLKHMYTGQRDHHKNVVIQYDADGKSCEQCMGNKKKDVLELFIRGKIS